MLLFFSPQFLFFIIFFIPFFFFFFCVCLLTFRFFFFSLSSPSSSFACYFTIPHCSHASFLGYLLSVRKREKIPFIYIFIIWDSLFCGPVTRLGFIHRWKISLYEVTCTVYCILCVIFSHRWNL